MVTSGNTMVAVIHRRTDRLKTVTVKAVRTEDWDTLTEIAVRCGLTMSELVHIFAQAMRERFKGSVRSSIQEKNLQYGEARLAHLESVAGALFPEVKS